MNRLASFDKNVIALGVACLGFFLFLLLYFFPRLGHLENTRQSADSLQSVRQEVSVLLPQVAQTIPTTPYPKPDVRSWVANNALAGMDKNLVANDGYAEGKGAQLKLRKLRPQQAAQFLSTLTRVRLITERMQLQDSDGDGNWDLEINLRVPE